MPQVVAKTNQIVLTKKIPQAQVVTGRSGGISRLNSQVAGAQRTALHSAF